MEGFAKLVVGVLSGVEIEAKFAEVNTKLGLTRQQYQDLAD
jgi:hypothetical protein